VVNHHSTIEIPTWVGPQQQDHTQGSRPELEKLLRMGEWLLDKCELYKSRTTWLFHYATGLGGAVLTAAGLVWTFLDPESPLRMALSGAIMGSAGAVASVSFAYWMTLRRRKARDQHALERVLELLRAQADGLGEREGLSPTERAMCQIRLTRLGVGVAEAAAR